MTQLPSSSLLPDQLPSTPSFIPENNQELGDEITRLAGHINAAQYRFLKLLAALIERGAWEGGSGMKTPAHWLNYYCGIDLGAAREKVRVAKCLSSLPLIDQAFSSGALSYSKVRAMTRTATPENEDYLLEIARHGTAQHMESLVKKYQRAERLCSAEHIELQHQKREFSSYYDDDGMLVFNGKLPAEHGAVFLKAMDAVLHEILKQEMGQAALDEKTDQQQQARPATTSGNQTRQRKSPAQGATEQCTREDRVAHQVAAQTSGPTPNEAAAGSADTFALDTVTYTFPQKRADALLLMSEHLLSTLGQGLSPLAGGDKYQVMIHIEANRHHETEQAHCHLDNGRFASPLSPETLRRLACDASLVTVLEDSSGNVLNVGRKTRTVPPSIRRALTIRDGGCRFPGCCESRFVDAHHIRHWCEGGDTSLDNLVLLCRYHHRLLHQDVFSIGIVTTSGEDGRASHLVFSNAAGETIQRALYPQFKHSETGSGESLAIELVNRELYLNIDSQTAITHWLG